MVTDLEKQRRAKKQKKVPGLFSCPGTNHTKRRYEKNCCSAYLVARSVPSGFLVVKSLKKAWKKLEKSLKDAVLALLLTESSWKTAG